MNESDNDFKSFNTITSMNSKNTSIISIHNNTDEDLQKELQQIQEKCNDEETEEAEEEEEEQQQQQQQSELEYDPISCNNKAIALVAQMNGIYEDRICEIDQKASGDYELKYYTYKEWVDMLIGVIRHMFENLSELELNAKTNIITLEKKLNECKIFDHTDVNTENLRNDLMSLLTLIRRQINKGEWDMTGLTFKTIKEEHVFGCQSKVTNPFEINFKKLNSQLIDNGHQIDRLSSQNSILKTELDTKDLLISNLECKLKKLENDSSCLCYTSLESQFSRTGNNNDYVIEDLQKCIREKEQLLAKELQKNEILRTELEVLRSKCDRKEKVIESMKALAYEVADKHDQIQQQKKQLFAMDEELQQALKKIQFKDSVIKDLRRELKNHLKKQLSICSNDLPFLTSRTVFSSLNSPDSRADVFCNCQIDNQQQHQIECIKLNEKGRDMNKRIEFEENKLNDCQIEEERSLKILGLELDELRQMKQCVMTKFCKDGNEELLEELEQLMQRFHKRVHDVVIEHKSTTNKLQHLRNQLLQIAQGKYKFDNEKINNYGNIYQSQEEIDFDNSLFIRINEKIINLEEQVCCFKEQIGTLQMEIQCVHSNYSSKTELLEKSSRILRDLAEHFAKISGTTIDIDSAFQSSDENELKDLCLYRNLFGDALEAAVTERDKKIQCLNDHNKKIQRDFEYYQKNVKKEIKQKEDKIENLERDFHFNNESVKILEHEKACLNEQIKKLSNLLNNSDLKKLINENEELQTLNKNQVKTISSLMEALESIKMEQGITSIRNNDNERLNNQRSNSNDSSTIIDNNQNRSGSLWGWLSGNTYDNSMLENQIGIIRDENLRLKERVTELSSVGILNKQSNNSNKLRKHHFLYSSIAQNILPPLEYSTDILTESTTSLLKTNQSEKISLTRTTQSPAFPPLNQNSTPIQEILETRTQDDNKQISTSKLFAHSNCNTNYNRNYYKCKYQKKYRDIINDMTTDLTDLINQVQNQFNECEIIMTEDNLKEFESNIQELENHNDLLQDTIELLQFKNSQNEIMFKRILEYKEEQYRVKVKTLEQEIEQSSNKYNALNRKHQALLYDVKQYKEKCKCGAIKAIDLDVTDKDAIIAATGRKVQDLQHIFDMMERKDDELKVLKEFSANEKARLNKRITDTEEQIKDYEVQIAVLKTNFEKKDNELKDIRRQFAEMSDDTQFRDIIDKLTVELSEEKAQRKERETTLEAKIKGLNTALDETRSSLAKSNDALASLEALSSNYQKQGDAAIKENAVLRDELFTLKGDIATLEGTERSLKSQLCKTQDEVQSLRTANVKIKTLSEDVDNFKQNCVRLKNTNFELITKYNSLIEDYNILADEFRNLSELKDVIEKELEVFRKWQKDQVDQDTIMKAHIQHLNEHIETLSEDRDELIQKIYDYHQDLLIVSSELDHYKEIFADTMGEAHDRASLAAGEMPGQDSADAIIRKILRTAEKLSHTRKTFQESLDRRDSK